jgi:AraC family transcriptional activator of pobA
MQQTEPTTLSILDVLGEKNLGLHTPGIGLYSGPNSGLPVNGHHIFRPDMLVILLVANGSMDIRYNMTDYTLEKNMIFFGFYQMQYEILATRPDLAFSSLTCSRQYAEQTGLIGSHLRMSRVSAETEKVVSQLTDEQAHYFNNLLQGLQVKMSYMHQTPLYTESLRYGLLSFMYDLFPFIFSGKGPLRLQRSEELTEKFLTLVEEKYIEEKTVMFYAAALTISPRHLSRVVKDSTGKLPHELIAERVIQEAKLQLTSFNARVSVVADFLKFGDQSLFGRFFKRYTGVSPNEYRRQYARARVL